MLFSRKKASFKSYLFRWKIKSDRLVIEMPVVCPIAKRFVFGQATAAQSKRRPALKPVHIALSVYNFKIALYLERTVRVYCNFCGSHCVKLKFLQR